MVNYDALTAQNICSLDVGRCKRQPSTKFSSCWNWSRDLIQNNHGSWKIVSSTNIWILDHVLLVSLSSKQLILIILNIFLPTMSVSWLKEYPVFEKLVVASGYWVLRTYFCYVVHVFLKHKQVISYLRAFPSCIFFNLYG
jgi:hypothetical protein